MELSNMFEKMNVDFNKLSNKRIEDIILITLFAILAKCNE